ncbi:MAG: FecR family protein [Candidatus Woesearchaeota archaeon]
MFKTAISLLIIFLLLSSSALLVVTQAAEENLPATFDITFGNNLPYPVTWLSSKTVEVVGGKGFLRSANAPSTINGHFSEENLDFNRVYLMITIDYNQQTGILSGAIFGQSSTQDPAIKVHYELTISDKKITKNNREGSLHCFGDGGNVFVDPQSGTVKHSFMDYNLGEFDLPYRVTITEQVGDDFPDSGAKFSDLAGQVEICLPSGYDSDGNPVYDGEDEWSFAKLDMKLPYGTKIRTSDRSSAILSFGDMSTFVLKEDTTIILGKATPDADNMLKLLSGQLWSNMKKMVIDGQMDIEMGQAVAGIKGTTFVLEEKNAQSTIKVIEGTVEFKSKTSGANIIVGEGEKVTATSQGLGSKTSFDVQTEVESWKDYLPDKQSEGLAGGIFGLLLTNTFLIIAAVIFLAICALGIIVYLRKKR